MLSETFCKVTHTPTGEVLFAFLTNEQLFSPQAGELVTAFREVNGGEMVPVEVLAQDIDVVEEC